MWLNEELDRNRGREGKVECSYNVVRVMLSVRVLYTCCGKALPIVVVD